MLKERCLRVEGGACETGPDRRHLRAADAADRIVATDAQIWAGRLTVQIEPDVAQDAESLNRRRS